MSLEHQLLSLFFSIYSSTHTFIDKVCTVVFEFENRISRIYNRLRLVSLFPHNYLNNRWRTTVLQTSYRLVGDKKPILFLYPSPPSDTLASEYSSFLLPQTYVLSASQQLSFLSGTMVSTNQPIQSIRDCCRGRS